MLIAYAFICWPLVAIPEYFHISISYFTLFQPLPPIDDAITPQRLIRFHIFSLIAAFIFAEPFHFANIFDADSPRYFQLAFASRLDFRRLSSRHSTLSILFAFMPPDIFFRLFFSFAIFIFISLIISPRLRQISPLPMPPADFEIFAAIFDSARFHFDTPLTP